MRHPFISIKPIFLASFIFSFPFIASAADAEWSAGAASVKITPEKPVVLAGYASRIEPFEKVDQDLYARAIALKDANGHRAVLVTLDICILPADVAEPVRKRIAENGKLEPANVLLCVSHTHSGPAVSLAPEAAPNDPDAPAKSAATIEYTRWLQERLVEVAGQALADLKPATLSWGSGIANFAMSRREYTEKGIILGINPRGIVDRTVPVLRIDGGDGKPRIVLFGYACHGTTNPPSYLGVSPDYPGYARKVIEEHFPGAQAMFIAGCGGDANPYPRLKLTDAPANGEELGKEVCRVADGKLQPIPGPLACALVTAQLPLETPGRDALQAIIDKGPKSKVPDAKAMLATVDRGEKLPAAHSAPVVAWQFGEDLTLIGLPDEVVADYVTLLEDKVGPLRLWVAAYCEEVMGYIPSKRILGQGGYETRGLYIGSGWFTADVQDVLVNAAQAAATEAGRKTPAQAP
jgi:neutral ceramidase